MGKWYQEGAVARLMNFNPNWLAAKVSNPAPHVAGTETNPQPALELSKFSDKLDQDSVLDSIVSLSET